MFGGRIDPDSFVAIGKVLKPRGIRGEAFLDPLTDFPERFQSLDRVWVELSEGVRIALRVESVRNYGSRFAIKFQGVETPETVVRFRGSYLLVSRDAIFTLPKNTFYVFEIVGLLVETEKGEEVGRIVDVLSYPSNDVFVVDRQGEEVLIPAVQDLLSIDWAGNRIVVRNLEGLF